MGDILVLAFLAVIVVLCIRSLIKQRKKGCCSGNCGSCTHCSANGNDNH